MFRPSQNEAGLTLHSVLRRPRFRQHRIQRGRGMDVPAQVVRIFRLRGEGGKPKQRGNIQNMAQIRRDYTNPCVFCATAPIVLEK